MLKNPVKYDTFRGVNRRLLGNENSYSATTYGVNYLTLTWTFGTEGCRFESYRACLTYDDDDTLWHGILAQNPCHCGG